MNAHFRRRFRRRLCLVGLLLLLAGCGSQEGWYGKSIRGLLPDLPPSLSEPAGNEAVRLLYFGYTHCPHVCPATLARLDSLSAQLGHPPDLRIVFVSVDPRRDTPPVLKSYLQRFQAPVLGVSPTQASLRHLSRRYRIAYGYGEADVQGDYLVSHPSGVYVFDRAGRARLLIRPTDGHGGMMADLRRLLAEAP